MGTRSNRLGEAVLTSTHNIYFEQKYEKYQYFLSANFQFLVVKFSIYFDKRVFVMGFIYSLIYSNVLYLIRSGSALFITFLEWSSLKLLFCMPVCCLKFMQ